MYTHQTKPGLPSMPLGRMLTSVFPFLALATPAVLLAVDVSNTAIIAAPAGAVDANQNNNTAVDTDTLAAVIVASPDTQLGISSAAGLVGAVNVYDSDTIDGNPATPATATVALAPGATLPAGITFNVATGQVDVAPGTAVGTYTFNYQICELALPDNCQITAVTLEVVQPLSEISGTVYLDLESDRELDGTDPRLGGWTVEVLTDGNVVASTVTAADGSYAFPGLPGGREYTIRFRDPQTGVVFEQIGGIFLEDATTLPNQNLPIDPSGIVYDAVTRAPVPGATVTLVDRNGTPLPDECYVDASQSNQVTGASGAYRFDVLPGAAAACPEGETEYSIRITPPAGFSFTSTILPPQPGQFDPTGRGSPVLISPSPLPPTGTDPTYFIGFRFQIGDPDVINNHLPLDPFLSRDGLIVTKTSTRRSASTGDLVPYEITVRNEEPYRRAGVDVVDVLPPGMSYVTGTARVNGVANEPIYANSNRELVWPGQIIPANGSVTYELVLVVGAGITEGQAVNTGVAENGVDGSPISNRGTATVSIIPSTVFDCSELIGQVFEDRNGNGYQDDGEPGIPSVRLATVNGQLITTDEYGRYHITCAAVPDARIGSNFVLRLDEETLPQGWAITTDNPRSIRLTRGKMSELNFGAARADLVSLSIDVRAFAADGSLLPEVLNRLQSLAEEDSSNLVIRANYTIAPGDDAETIAARITAIRAALASVFAGDRDRPTPIIQVDAVGAVPAAGGEQP